MRRILLLLGTCLVISLVFAPAAGAQNAACADVQDRLNAGDSSLTSAELLSCGLSPEAIGEGPSIQGPEGVGTDNACSDLPQGSPQSVACFEELIADMDEPATDDPAAQPSAPAADGAAATQYADDDEMTELPDTGGPALLLPIAGLVLIGLGGLIFNRR